jgi:hypothetical protein
MPSSFFPLSKRMDLLFLELFPRKALELLPAPGIGIFSECVRKLLANGHVFKPQVEAS